MSTVSDAARRWVPTGLERARSDVPLGIALVLALGTYALAPWSVLALLGAVAFALGAAARPALGLAVVLATLPLYYLPRELGGLAVSLPEAALLLTALAVVARAAGHPARSAGVAPVARATSAWARLRAQLAATASSFDPWIATLLLAGLLSLLPTEYWKLSLRALRTLLLEPLLFYYLVLGLCPTPRALRPLVIGFLGAAVLVAGLAVLQVCTNLETVEVEGVRRALGTYPSPNHLGLYLGRAAPFAIALTIWVPTWRPVSSAAAALLLVALGATFSIGAWLGTAAAALVLAAVLGRRALAVVLIGGGGIAALALLAFSRLGVERVLSGTTFAFRRHIWASALQMLRDHPLAGIGMDNFLYRYQLEYILPEAWAEPNISHPHNWVLQFWLELGLLGLVALVALIVRFAWLAIQVLRRPCDPWQRALTAGALASMAGLLVHGSGDNSYFLADLAVLFWFHIAVVEIVARWRNRSTCG